MYSIDSLTGTDTHISSQTYIVLSCDGLGLWPINATPAPAIRRSLEVANISVL